MILYCLNIDRDHNDSAGENPSVWVGSLSMAKKCRVALVSMRRAEVKEYKKALARYNGGDTNPEDWVEYPTSPHQGGDLSIDRVEFAADISPRNLALAILNGKGYVHSTECVVEPVEECRI